MAHVVTNRGLYLLGKDDASALDLRFAVFTDAVAVPAAATIRDYNYLSELDAVMTEAAVTGYARVDAAGVTLTEVDGTDEVTFVCDDDTMASVAAGETWIAIAYYKYNASDAAADLISVDEPAATLITNGGNVTVPGIDLSLAQA